MALKGVLTNLAPKSVFITGSNRGIGLTFIKHLLKLPNPPCHIFATCREPSKAVELQALASENSSVNILKYEVTDYASLPEIVAKVDGKVGADGLNLLINNAGILERDDFDSVTPEQMRKHFEVNTIAPLMLAKAMIPLLKKAAKDSMSASNACVATLTSKVGSIADNTSGNIYSYRSSKSAVNQVNKSMSINLADSGILCVVLHPGWVQTEMGGPRALISTDECVSGLLKVLAAMDQSHNGSFYDFKGVNLPW